MPHATVDDALASVPFLAPLGLSVDRVDAGEVVLRVPADKRTRDFDGYIASGALFTAGELAATLVLATHSALAGRQVLRQSATITYTSLTNRPVRAQALLPPDALDGVTADTPEITVTTELLDRNDLAVAIVVARFALGPVTNGASAA